ncbi:hypothetical protein SAMN05216378_1973 [Paenibacillus catalpae]|uniref:Uncharacterized protein n=1 Tax=Paenibacillus catalpae TaxID=1045775 RepID=A0A1I1X1J6_9BACL|nr:hypothetical protein SAMN05216378_1973 [Paenibacillus catalpae]
MSASKYQIPYYGTRGGFMFVGKQISIQAAIGLAEGMRLFRLLWVQQQGTRTSGFVGSNSKWGCPRVISPLYFLLDSSLLNAERATLDLVQYNAAFSPVTRSILDCLQYNQLILVY